MVAEVLDVPADDLLAFGREPVARDGFPEPRWRIVIERSEQNVEKELVDPSDDAGHRGVAAIEVLPPRLAKLACGALVVGDELAHLSETLVDVKPIDQLAGRSEVVPRAQWSDRPHSSDAPSWTTVIGSAP